MVWFMEWVVNRNTVHGKALWSSHKHESIFTSVTIQKTNPSGILHWRGSTLGVWVSHGEGKFNLPMGEENTTSWQNMVRKLSSNPNGSDAITRQYCVIKQVITWWWCHTLDSSLSVELGALSKTGTTSFIWHEAFVNARLWIDKI
jgi:phosphoribosylformylglycinamidine synthase